MMNKAIKEASDYTAASIRGLGDVAGRVARNEFFSVITDVPRKLVAFLDSIPIIGAQLAAPIKITLAAADAVKQVTDSLLVRAKELGQFSAPIAVAEAMAEVRQVFADLHEGQKIGTDLARLIDAQSRLNANLQELFTPLKAALAQFLADVLERANTIVEFLNNNKDALVAMGKGVIGALSPITGLIIMIRDFIAWIKGEAQKPDADREKEGALWQQLLGQMGVRGEPWGAGNRAWARGMMANPAFKAALAAGKPFAPQGWPAPGNFNMPFAPIFGQ
jgi:hypothetical protein